MRRRKNNIVFRAALISLPVIAGTVSARALAASPVPFLWIYGAWFACFLGLTAAVTGRKLKLTYLYSAVIFLSLGLCEAFLWNSRRAGGGAEQKRDHFSVQMNYGDHDILGFAPFPNRESIHTRTLGEEIIFRARYTIGPDGLRISPPSRPDAREAIVFFGCSYMFGTGVNNQETIPYRVGVETGGRYRIYNFGYQGYGPHQMLSALEKGLVESVVRIRPRYVIYQALPSHIERVAGLAVWDTHGPKYRLDADGRAVFRGYFDDDTNERGLLFSACKLLEKSLIFEAILKKLNAREACSRHNTRLFIEVVAAAKRLIENRVPGCEFHMLLWDWPPPPHLDVIMDRAEAIGLQMQVVSDILPDFKRKRMADYALHPNEAHPSALAYRMIARHITRSIIGPGQPEPTGTPDHPGGD